MSTKTQVQRYGLLTGGDFVYRYILRRNNEKAFTVNNGHLC